VSDPGTLRQRLLLEAPVETTDGAGGVTRTYAAAASLWAEIVPLSARPAVAAGAAGALGLDHIRIRMRRDLTTAHRLRQGTRVWRIVGLREDQRGRFLTIDAQEWRD
jgi:SPP1 family predicted phage head-tail adaptor